MKEIWKDIPNYESEYQVSNLGRVKSLKFGKEKVLNSNLISNGYCNVKLCKDGEKKDHTIHRLIMIAFVGESKLTVNHINGIKTDNRLENLEYCTQSENIQHAFENGLIKVSKGEKNGRSKINEIEARQIKYGYKGWAYKRIARIYNIGIPLVSKIRSGKLWSHI
jgi:hypothetical protein